MTDTPTKGPARAQALDALAQRLWHESTEALAGRHRQRGEPSVRAVSDYLDPAVFARETAALRRLPLAVASTDQIAQPGDWRSLAVHGVPVLLVRDAEGELRAFLNVCRHRGALLAPENASGSGKSRFVCPYHCWTYDSRGHSVGRPHEADFPHVPREAASLVALPVAERLGMVWVVATPLHSFDWDAYFGPLGEELAALGYGAQTTSPHQRAFSHPSNWKLVYEGNLESYHFQYAHRKTIAALFHDNIVVQEQLGDHQRIVLPRQSMAQVEQGTPVDAQLLGRHSHVIYYFFPCTLVLWEGDHLNLSTAVPTAVDRCDVNGWLLVPERYRDRRPAEHWERNHRLFWEALDEDYALAASIQRGLASGANTELRFGRNEFACEAFWQSLQRAMQAA